jgi:hypothetical protein
MKTRMTREEMMYLQRDREKDRRTSPSKQMLRSSEKEQNQTQTNGNTPGLQMSNYDNMNRHKVKAIIELSHASEAWVEKIVWNSCEHLHVILAD